MRPDRDPTREELAPPTAAVTAADGERAWQRIRGALIETPIVPYGPSARLKLESRQVTGAFKVRGALNALTAGLERGDLRGVVAASAGNHALGVAWAARRLGLSACVVVPHGAPTTKLSGAAALGAEVLVHGDRFEESLAYARTVATTRQWRFLHPFDEPDVIAGQGTVATELVEQLQRSGAPLPDVVVIPVGGGGLAAGMGLVLRRHGIHVVGVQVEGVDAMRRILHRDPIPCAPQPTIADGLRVLTAGHLTAAICEEVVDDIVTVSEQQVRAAIVILARDHGLTVEGAGAAAVAALPQIAARRPLAIISGGNIDAATLRGLIAADGRHGRRGANPFG